MGDPGSLSPHGPGRWLRVGQSSDADAGRAGGAAIAQALGQGEAKLVIVFCSDAYDLDALLSAINDRSQGAPLIGCSTAGEIATEGPGQSSVVVIALGGDGFSVATGAAAGAPDDLRAAGAGVAACAAEVEYRPHRAQPELGSPPVPPRSNTGLTAR